MPPLTPVSANEASLIGRILEGEKELFYELIRPYQRSVYLAAWAVLRNQSDAEEITQEAFLKSFRALATFRGEAQFGTWLRRIAVNEAHMRLRRERRGPTQPLEGNAEEGADGAEPHVPIELSDWREWPSEALERSEVREAIADALSALPENYRQILICRDVNQLSVAEASDLLGISASAVKIRLWRARLMIRDRLVQTLGEQPLNGRTPQRGRRPWS